MNAFIESVHNEDEPEVEADIDRLKAIATDMHSNVELSVGESGMLKDGIDPLQVVGLVEKYTEGIVYGWNNSLSIDETMKDVSQCLDMLKKHLCK